jgi:hypothetical protein
MPFFGGGNRQSQQAAKQSGFTRVARQSLPYNRRSRNQLITFLHYKAPRFVR